MGYKKASTMVPAPAGKLDAVESAGHRLTSNEHESVRLRYSSLYSVVEALRREGLILALKTRREGRRPERTVFGLTDVGRAEFLG